MIEQVKKYRKMVAYKKQLGMISGKKMNARVRKKRKSGAWFTYKKQGHNGKTGILYKIIV